LPPAQHRLDHAGRAKGSEVRGNRRQGHWRMSNCSRYSPWEIGAVNIADFDTPNIENLKRLVGANASGTGAQDLDNALWRSITTTI
jgi:hypothetical protein